MKENIRDAKKNETKRENIRSRKPKKEFSQSKQSPVGHILHLQRTIGNRAVTRLIQSGKIQAKLKIGKPNDIYEKEADRVADRVVTMPDSAIQRQPNEEEKEEIQAKPLAEQITPLVRRQPEEEEEIQQKALLQRQVEEEEEEPVQTKSVQRQEEEEEEEAQTRLQRQPEEEEELQEKSLIQRQNEEEEEEAQAKPLLQRQVDEEEEVQSKAAPGSAPKVTPNIESNINSMKGGGQPLSESTRSFFESRFGVDFSKVRVHTDSRAAETAQAINAKAFTTGKDIFFNSGQYAPGTTPGNHLVAHELTHVMQQGKISKIKKNSFASRKTPAAFLQSSGIVLQRKRKLNPQKVKYANQQLWEKYPKIKGQRLTKSNAYALFRNEWWAYYRWGENKVTGEKEDRQIKLDPQKVKYANQQLWEKYPKLKGLRLTKSRAFTVLAKEWWKYYRMGKILDPQRVKYANQKLWKNHPELKGRELTYSKKDAQLRKEWWKYYKQGKKKKVGKKNKAEVFSLWDEVDKVPGKKYDLKLDRIISLGKKVAKNKNLKYLGISSSVLTYFFAEVQKGKLPPNVYITLLKNIDSFLTILDSSPKAMKIFKSISSGLNKLEKFEPFGKKILSRIASITDALSLGLRIYYNVLEKRELLKQINNHFWLAGNAAQMAWHKIGVINPNISGEDALELLYKLVKKNSKAVMCYFGAQNMENKNVKDLAGYLLKLKEEILKGYIIINGKYEYISKEIAKYFTSLTVNIASLIPFKGFQLYALVGSAVMLTEAPDKFLASDFLDWIATKFSIDDRDTVTKKIIKLGIQPKIRFYQIR